MEYELHIDLYNKKPLLYITFCYPKITSVYDINLTNIRISWPVGSDTCWSETWPKVHWIGLLFVNLLAEIVEKWSITNHFSSFSDRKVTKSDSDWFTFDQFLFGKSRKVIRYRSLFVHLWLRRDGNSSCTAYVIMLYWKGTEWKLVNYYQESAPTLYYLFKKINRISCYRLRRCPIGPVARRWGSASSSSRGYAWVSSSRWGPSSVDPTEQ